MKMSIDKAIRFALLAPFVAGMIIYGGGKPGPGQRPSRFFFDDYLSDIGSYSTNDIVHVASVKSSLQIPDDTPMHVYAALMGTTNWTELLPSRTYADQPADWTLADATNYDYIVMLDWVPPAPVVTNDILTVNALAAKGSTPPGTTLHAVLPRVALVTPIEYLEATGTQWIDTGIVGNLDTSYEITFSPTKAETYGIVIGRRASATSGNIATMAPIGTTGTGRRSVLSDFGNYNTTRQTVIFSTVVGIKFTCYNSRNLRTVFNHSDGQSLTDTKSYSTSFTTPGTLLIAATSSGFPASSDNFIGNLYSCKIWQDGVLVRDFQPVRVGRVGYMYDRVSGEYLPFGNKGTGSFILGPDITE